MDPFDPTDDSIPDPDVLKSLRAWRAQECRQQQVPAYWILTNRMLASLAVHVPRTLEDLRPLPGLGKGRIDKYGEAILKAIEEGCSSRAAPDPVTQASPDDAPMTHSEPIDTTLARLVYRIPSVRRGAVLAAAGIHGLASGQDLELTIGLASA